ncbi:MAG: tetratricopeptide repeat protein [Acidobacteriota bacterium]
MYLSLTQGSKFLLPLCLLMAILGCSSSQTSVQANVQKHSNANQVMELMRVGSAYYLKHDFENAIGPYQKALDLERENRTLDDTFWKVLVDNLGMSYGITGNLDKAKEVFAYGISKEPDYPMFYYNMACTYGEKDDMEKAIEYLRLAFDRRENMIAGERMPNPATDSSFERFMKEEKFKAALKELKH